MILNTGPAPRSGAAGSTLWSILEARPHQKYYLSPKACQGILRRSAERGKELPWKLEKALKIQSGLLPLDGTMLGRDAYHINQRDEGINLHGVSGALMATTNMQMQTFITGDAPVGIDSKHACTTGGIANTLSTNCGSPTGRNGVMLPMAFAQNQRDEVRDLHAVAGALSAQQGMKQQTYVAMETDTSALCLNDQGGQFMSSSENIAGTLRAQMHSHQPLILATQQGGAEIGAGICPTITASAGMSGNNQPVLYENHGMDSRYKGPYSVSPTLSARAGTGGNNLSLIAEDDPKSRCMIFSRQRTDCHIENDVVSTESARQHKDATDLVMQPYQETVGTLVRSDHKGISNQYVSDDKCVVEYANLIRRLTPLECERLQGFPDEWTNIPGASDSARYKALGNSVAIPCVDFVLGGIAAAIRSERRRRRGYLIPASQMAA